MAAPHDATAAASASHTQLGLDEDDWLFGRFSRALLEHGTLAMLHLHEAVAAGGLASASRPAACQPRAIHKHDNPRSFRVAVDRTGGFAESGGKSDAVVTSISAFDIEDAGTPGSRSTPAIASTLGVASPGETVWHVRPAFAAKLKDTDDLSTDGSSPSLPYPALCVTKRVRTLFNHASLNSAWANVFAWSLPALACLLYVVSSNQTITSQAESNSMVFTVAFFIASLLSLALIFSRIDTSFLLKQLLCTFESLYLIAWMIIFLVAFAVQIPNEITVRAVELGLSASGYIFAQCTHAFAVLVCFAVVLCSDALIRLSVWFKVYVRPFSFLSSMPCSSSVGQLFIFVFCPSLPISYVVQIHTMFVIVAIFMWIDDRFIHPDRLPVTICLGSVAYSCTDTVRVRIGSLFAISLFVFRNIVIMLRHQYRSDARALFGGVRTQRLLLVKSSVILHRDESRESTATIEPETPPSGSTGSPAATSNEAISHTNDVSDLSNDLRVLDMDDATTMDAHLPPVASEARPDAATAFRDVEFERVVFKTPSMPSLSDGSVVSQSDSVHNTAMNDDPEVQSLHMYSLFGVDVESCVRSPRMFFGAAISNLWNFSYFRGGAVLIFLTVLVLSFITLPRNSLLMLCSLWALVIVFSICMMTLVDLRIVSELARTFEYWFLHILNVVSFVAACSNLVNEADGAAAFIGNDRNLQLLNDICWNFIYLVGCALVVVADAVAIRRSLKIALILFWITTLVRVMWWRIWFTYQQPYMLPLDVCIWTECFSVQVIRLQASMTFALFSAKYAFSLYRFPRALVILKSTVVMGVIDEDSDRASAGGAVGASDRAQGVNASSNRSGCDAEIAGSVIADRAQTTPRIPQ
jgi:hypothetical protein